MKYKVYDCVVWLSGVKCKFMFSFILIAYAPSVSKLSYEISSATHVTSMFFFFFYFHVLGMVQTLSNSCGGKVSMKVYAPSQCNSFV